MGGQCAQECTSKRGNTVRLSLLALQLAEEGTFQWREMAFAPNGYILGNSCLFPGAFSLAEVPR